MEFRHGLIIFSSKAKGRDIHCDHHLPFYKRARIFWGPRERSGSRPDIRLIEKLPNIRGGNFLLPTFFIQTVHEVIQASTAGPPEQIDNVTTTDDQNGTADST